LVFKDQLFHLGILAVAQDDYTGSGNLLLERFESYGVVSGQEEGVALFRQQQANLLEYLARYGGWTAVQGESRHTRVIVTLQGGTKQTHCSQRTGRSARQRQVVTPS
jgi:hypothetical protein